MALSLLSFLVKLIWGLIFVSAVKYGSQNIDEKLSCSSQQYNMFEFYYHINTCKMSDYSPCTWSV